jgi:hypothetical protein
MVALAYPILGLFLAAAWSLHNVRVWQIGNYIREKIEGNFLDSDQGWEYVRPKGRAVRLGPLPSHGARGILIGTQILAVFVSLVIAATTDVDALVRYAQTLPDSSRAFLKAAVRTVTEGMAISLKGQATPGNVN